MYDELKRHIESTGRQQAAIERPAAGGAYAETDTRLIANHVAAQVEIHMRALDDGSADAAARGLAREFGGLRTRRQLESHFTERLRADLESPPELVELALSSDSQLFTPPYDLQWATGNGVASRGCSAGKLFTVPSHDGLSAAAVGFYATAHEPTLAAITPQGCYHFQWIALDDLPFARSAGGLGITIYRDAQPQPITSHRPILWSTSGMTTFSYQKGGGRLARAMLPAGSALPLAPALLHMVPGSRYAIWMWCWQAARLDDDDAFLAFSSVSMPVVTIDTGSPIG